MTILVTGANGQLGSELRQIAKQQTQVKWLFTDVEELDITNQKVVFSFFETQTIDVVINGAAYTQVDKAEANQDLAHRVNVDGVAHLAEACAKHNALLFHISTDFVFGGQQNTPYKETDTVHPIGIYAKTKYQGEQKALQLHDKTVIIRTSWLYSSFGHNFVKTMLRLGKERSMLKVVYDQIGSPTYARDLAVALWTMVQQKEKITQSTVYHYANHGVGSWYDLAVAVMKNHQLNCQVHPIETKDYPTPAQRPHYSVLHTAKIKQDFNLKISHWQDALEHCCAMLR